MPDLSYKPLITPAYKPIDVARHIARTLEAGQASPLFLRMLAAMIDPDRKKGRPSFVLKVERRSAGAPKRVNWPLIDFMTVKVDSEGNSPEVAAALAKQQFGAGRSASFAALKKGREWRDAAATLDALSKKTV